MLGCNRADRGRAFLCRRRAKLFPGTYVDGSSTPVFRSYDVARDGRFLMLEQAGGAAVSAPSVGIVVVQNFTHELERRVPHK